LTNPKQKLVKDKHSSLSCFAISDEDVKFFNVDTWLILALGIENFRKTRMNLLKGATTISINNTQHKKTIIMPSAIVLSVAFDLLLC
jgi:hypothetical protein